MRFGPVFTVYVLILSLLISTVYIGGENGISDGIDLPVDQPSRSSPVDETEWPMLLGDPTHHGYSGSEIPLENTTDILWGQRITSLMGTASPIVKDGVVYIGSGDGHMKGYDIDTGAEVWDVHIGNHRIRAAGAIDNGRIYFGADNGHLYGFDLQTMGKTLDVNLGGAEIESSPLVIDGRIYIGVVGAFLKNHKFHAVDIETQTINWTLSMGDEDNFYGFKETAAYSNGWIYIGDGNGTFYCLDAEGFWDGNDGEITNETNVSLNAPDIIWKRTGENSILTDALIAEGKVYFGIDNGKLVCLNATTGEEVWIQYLGRGDRALQSCPTYKDGRLYLAARYTVTVFDGASVYCLDPSSGSQIWRFNITGQIITESSPIIVDDHLIFGSRNHKVYCISTVEEKIADEDRIQWTVSTGSPITSTPAVADGRVFVSNEPLGSFGKLFAIGAPDPSIQEVWVSDPAPYAGESVMLMADLWNNATVDCTCDIEFIVSTFNNSKQYDAGILRDIYVPAGESTRIGIEWIADTGYDFVGAIIKDSTPKDMDTDNNLGSIDLNVKTPFTKGWASEGGGPERTSGSGTDLESNRSFWEMNLGASWSGQSGSIWYDGISGNGSISSSGAGLYMVDPAGNLIALNTTPEESGLPGYLWKYSNSSVDFIGKPVLLIEKDRGVSGPNRVYANGDDGALWAFDWFGFRDGINDGPFLEETATSDMDGDVIWRTELLFDPSGPMLVCGGNIILQGDDGSIRGIDDDEGSILWTLNMEVTGIVADQKNLFLFQSNNIHVVDPNSGTIMETMTISGLSHKVEIISMSVTDGGLLVSTSNGTIMMENHPIDSSDDGFKDNSSTSDIVWFNFYDSDLASPPAIAPDGSGFCVVSGNRAFFHHLNNGTEINNLSIPGPVNARVVSGGGSYYLITGAEPWTMRAFAPLESGLLHPTWTLELDFEPMSEMVIVGNHLFISLRDGSLISLGANNNDPSAVIGSPSDGILVFPGEIFTIDSSGSFDIDEDALSYVWYIEGEAGTLYEGTDTSTDISINEIGKKKLILRVYDDMGAYGEAMINLTVLKRITEPDFNEDLYDINVHMSYGISETSGRGIVSASIPEELPDAPGSVFTCFIDFDPWPAYAEYKFEWANVTIEYADKEFKQIINEEKMGVYYYDESLSEWIKAPLSGITSNSSVYGNFSSLRPGFYAIGILDNDPPEFRHREVENYRYRQLDSVDFKFRVEYRDEDNDPPVYIKLMIDNNTEYDLMDEGFASTVTRWSFFSVEDVPLAPGDHTYFFIADDGNFQVRSDYYHYFVVNTPPVAKIIGPTSIVYAGDIVLFDGSGSYDPDGGEVTLSWDFNDVDGIQKDKVGKKVDHIFIEEGNYVVTLTVSDKVDKTEKTLSITVIDPDEGKNNNQISGSLWILILSVIGILILAIVIFIVISKREHEDEPDLKRDFEGTWTCPECGERNPSGVEECSSCDYILDPIDFEDEDELDLYDDLDEM